METIDLPPIVSGESLTIGTKPITSIEGERVAKEIGAKRYLECSAKEGWGVREVFDAALRESMKRKGGLGRGRGGKKCVVL